MALEKRHKWIAISYECQLFKIEEDYFVLESFEYILLNWIEGKKRQLFSFRVFCLIFLRIFQRDASTIRSWLRINIQILIILWKWIEIQLIETPQLINKSKYKNIMQLNAKKSNKSKRYYISRQLLIISIWQKEFNCVFQSNMNIHLNSKHFNCFISINVCVGNFFSFIFFLWWNVIVCRVHHCQCDILYFSRVNTKYWNFGDFQIKMT